MPAPPAATSPTGATRAIRIWSDKANLVTDQAERAKLYIQAQQIIHDQVPGILFADAKGFVALRNNVHGFKIHFFGGQPFGGVSLSQ